MRIENERALEAQRWIDRRLGEPGIEVDEASVLERIAPYPFHKYPDCTAPFYRIAYPHMRWRLVSDFVEIIEVYKQPTGSKVGRPITLQPFQILILLLVLGPYDPATNKRLVREALLTLARKNGKTALVAAIALTFMVLDRRAGGLYGQQIQIGAADREQAGIMHHMASMFTTLDEELGLGPKIHSVPSTKRMTHRFTQTELKCLSSDAYRSHGGNPAIVLLDEMGNVPSNQAAEFYSVLTTGFGAQEEPLTWLLSTQAPNDQHFFSQQVDLAKRINDGMVDDPQFCGFVYVTPEVDQDNVDIDPFDERFWYLGNPGLGTICNLEDMRNWAKRARELPSLENKFRNLKLNQRVSETASFLSRRAWMRNSGEYDLRDLEGASCYLGLDLAQTTDLCALVAVFEPLDDRGLFPVLCQYWIPGQGLRERSDRDKVPYDVWSRDGLIDTSSNEIVDYSKIATTMIGWAERYDVLCLGFDRWKMKDLKPHIKDHFSIEKDEGFLIEIGQGFKDANRSVQITEEIAVQGLLAHNGHPILSWNVANAVTVKDPALNRKFEKARSFGRIDGCVAMSLSLHAREIYLANPVESATSVYESGEGMVM